MALALWFFAFFATIVVSLYQRLSLTYFALITAVELALLFYLVPSSLATDIIITFSISAALIPLLIPSVRRKFISSRVLKFYLKSLPSMSSTERDALEAGTVSWDADIFSGKPDWNKLHHIPARPLSNEEQAFLNGPVEELCKLASDWQISHEYKDLPPEVWQYIKDKGFWGMIIPKQYGGLEFSASAQSQVIAKLSSHSTVLSVTVSVPNSLGPGELLMHYGTQAQKDYYLPRLAKGEEVPCFALTAPDAGSDAASIVDSGVVCKGTFDGKEVLGIRLNWNKRYITLAPVATVLGLAFKLYDPEHLLGTEEEYGITCALIPTDLPGITIGRRHLPLSPFQNGPTQGENVFVPLDYIIGGQEMAGQGWRMLMECLSAGRSITLPSSSLGMAKVLTAATGAYARVRQQFNIPIGYMEGVSEVLARIVGRTYMIEASCSMTSAIVDNGEKPSVLSGIMKYHATEVGRQILLDIMDVHGGKAIIEGPKNYISGAYAGAPIGITVEGANILTRSMIIFGQGMMRAHPYMLDEFMAAQHHDKNERLKLFDRYLFKHIGYSMSNMVRAFFLGLTDGKIAAGHSDDKDIAVIYKRMTRLSSAFTVLADFSAMILGGHLKRREMISARLGDVLSAQYLLSCVLKVYADRGAPQAEKDVVRWVAYDLTHWAQGQMDAVLSNFPNKWVAKFLRVLIFPTGMLWRVPNDAITEKVSHKILHNGAFRDRLIAGTFIPEDDKHPIYQLEQAMHMVSDVEPLLKKLRTIKKQVGQPEPDLATKLQDAVKEQLLTEEEAALVKTYEILRLSIINVDDFSQEMISPIAKQHDKMVKTTVVPDSPDATVIKLSKEATTNE